MDDKHHAAEQRTVLAVTMLSAFVTPFVLSAVNVAMPALARDLGLTAIGLGWVSLAFLLSSSILLVPMGRLADINGRKRAFSTGLAVFAAASLGCALAPGQAWLIVFRLLQGAGASMIFGTGIAILTSVFPPEKRGRALGLASAAVYTGLSVGPAAGGFLVEALGWRSIFFISAALSSAALALVLSALKGEWHGAKGEKFDLPGSALYVAAMGALMYGLSTVPSRPSVLLAPAGLAGLWLFARRQSAIPHPILDVRLMASNTVFAYSGLAAFISYVSTFSVGFLLSLYLQYARGLSAREAGLTLLWMPVFMGAFSPLAGRLSDRVDAGRVASAGMAISGLGLIFFLFLTPASPPALAVAGLATVGFGLALFSSPNTNAVMGSLERRHYGIGAATLSTMRVSGQMTSMAVVMMLFSVHIGRAPLGPDNVDGLLKALRAAIAISLALSCLGVWASLRRGPARA